MKRLSMLLVYAVLLAIPSFPRSAGRSTGSHSRAATHSTSPSRSVGAHTRSSAKCASCARDSHGKIKRSPTAKRDFRRQNPCPSTGKTSGPCPGYVIDHRVALKHHGMDEPSNMQWQTTADSKAKDRVE